MQSTGHGQEETQSVGSERTRQLLLRLGYMNQPNKALAESRNASRIQVPAGQGNAGHAEGRIPEQVRFRDDTLSLV